MYIYIYNAKVKDKEYNTTYFRNSEFHAACATVFSKMN